MVDCRVHHLRVGAADPSVTWGCGGAFKGTKAGPTLPQRGCTHHCAPSLLACLCAQRYSTTWGTQQNLRC